MITEGDIVPLFEGTDQNGNVFAIKDYIGDRILVIYFYPKNFTPGCTAEACDFRDQYEVFKSQGAIIIGVSNDSVDSHSHFAQRYQLPFIMISDKENQIRKLFGIKSTFLGLLPGRETFVVDKKGMIRLRFNSIQAKRHVPRILKMINRLNAL